VKPEEDVTEILFMVMPFAEPDLKHHAIQSDFNRCFCVTSGLLE